MSVASRNPFALLGGEYSSENNEADDFPPGRLTPLIPPSFSSQPVDGDDTSAAAAPAKKAPAAAAAAPAAASAAKPAREIPGAGARGAARGGARGGRSAVGFAVNADGEQREKRELRGRELRTLP